MKRKRVNKTDRMDKYCADFRNFHLTWVWDRNIKKRSKQLFDNIRREAEN